MGQVKILIGTPVLSDPKTRFVSSLLNYFNNHKYQFQFRFVHDTYIHNARNRLVYQAVEYGATHLMFIDSDMMFPHWGIDRLVDRNFDIVGGLYFGRKVPRPIALNIDPRDRKPKVIGKIESKTEPFQVSIVGTGFMLINMNVFKKVDPPFFYHEKPTEFGLAELPFPHNELGEDMVFCLKAQEKGFKVWVDPTIPLGHIGEHVYNEVDYHLFDDESTRYIYEPEERIK